MKTEISMCKIKQNYVKCYYAGYGDLHYIMSQCTPRFYNYGVYGWNCDIYINDYFDIAISTGYRNMIGKRIPDEIIKEYTEKAKECINSTILNYMQKLNQLNTIRHEFFETLNNL